MYICMCVCVCVSICCCCCSCRRRHGQKISRRGMWFSRLYRSIVYTKSHGVGGERPDTGDLEGAWYSTATYIEF
ncbi:uncharacterized protein BO72DRAFT_4209 [Aspergillus fijiensis CBS 313.89]|uniref:Secreted protein n=1 Tax=Aspergillus fijiensis CBS 313.89 TaxID=1448319 RepID=A0A8G1W4G3_9EURO|nr:uncharacterized protein BO72DRAFT_4209 [Aspergillus fijiensis CBS 313.89]RAK82636.1 hypothetical protein BO72DRAFT_4209 [Aspergillus fijiensis CBS 313.89]